MDAVQAAVLSAKLPHLDRWTLARRAVANRYRAALGSLLDWQSQDPDSEAHHIFPILVDDRDAVQGRLREDGISTGVHYRQALSTIEAFGPSDRCPASEWRAARQLSLPIHPYLTDGDIDRIIGSLSACTSRLLEA
jgi:dTDP-4-amino-4,6-dideoxygalactose transaminase